MTNLANQIERLSAAATPAAYMHTMHMEHGQSQVRLSHFSTNPFGIPGEDYSEEYPITTEPLFLRAADEVEALRARVAELRNALMDLLTGWRYIRHVHGDLSGVGWDRCEDSASKALGNKP